MQSFEEKDSQYLIQAGSGKTPASALLELQPPAQHRVEFHVQCKVADSGLSRNGGLAFGPGSSPEELIYCAAYIRGRELRIRGENLVGPVSVEATGLDSAQPLDCTVIVNLDEHRVTFRVGRFSAEAALKPSSPSRARCRRSPPGCWTRTANR